MSQSMHNNLGSTEMQGSSSLLFESSPESSLHQPTMASGAGPSSSLQNIPNMSSVKQEQLIGDTSMESDDWRDQLQADSRERIISKIMETLKRHLPYPENENAQEVKKIAELFEKKIYTAATSPFEYRHKISLKMMLMEGRGRLQCPNPILSNSAGNSVKS